MQRTQFLTPFAASLVLAALGCTLSCSVIIDTKTKQCDSNADCAALSSTATCSADHVCVGAAASLGCQEEPKSTAETVTLTFDVSLTSPPSDPTKRMPFTIHACKTTDPTCAAPITDDLIVPYGEVASLEVPPGFEGYLEVNNPDGLPAMEFLGRPINVDTHGYDLIVPTPATVLLLVALTGETYSTDNGIFVITTRDCMRQPLAGVSVQNTLGGTPFIFQNMSPQKTLTETTDEGAAGFVNVPAGIGFVSAKKGGAPLTGTSVFSRGGWVTYVEIFP